MNYEDGELVAVTTYFIISPLRMKVRINNSRQKMYCDDCF